jgi:hypothetical protein
MQNTSAEYTITIGSISGLPVTLGVTGLPSGATAAFSPSSLQPPVGGTTPSILVVTVRYETPVGSYPLNVTASDSSGTHWVIVTLNVAATSADFVISVLPNSLTINTTESKTAIVTVQSIAAYSQNTTLSVTGLPAHVTATVTPTAPWTWAGGTAHPIMRITVGADAISGTYPLTVVGTGFNGTLTHSAPLTLIVVPTEASVAGGNMGLAFAFIGIGVGVAVAGVGAAFALSGQGGSEAIVYGGYYYCRKHRVPLSYVNGGLWCPIERRPMRTS